MRCEISILSELQRGEKVKGRTCKWLKGKYNLDGDNILETKEVIKQKVHLKAQRVRRFEKRF